MLSGAQTGLTTIAYLSYTTSKMQGLLNAIVYGLNPSIRNKIF